MEHFLCLRKQGLYSSMEAGLNPLTKENNHIKDTCMTLLHPWIKNIYRLFKPAAAVALVLMVNIARAGGLPTADPASVGLSMDGLAKLGAAMQAEVDAGRKAGIVVLVARQGNVAYLKAFGMANRETGKPMQSDSLVRLYSMTKPITSVALLTLFEQGKFKLSDPLDKYIPEMKHLWVYASENAYGSLVGEKPNRMPTILDVFRHTAGFSYGLGDSPVDLMYRQNGISYEKAASLKDMVAEKLPRMPLLYQPGTRWVYSFSHDVQAYLVEYFSGMPFDEYLQKTIFGPLGMTDTFFGIPDKYVDRYTANYGPDGKGGLKQIEDSDGGRQDDDANSYRRYNHIPFGGSGLSSTAMDYAKFGQMLINGGELNGVRILKKETVEQMTTNQLPEAIGYLGPPGPGGTGYGLGVSVLVDVAASGNLGSKGQFGWAGAATTFVIMDPKEEMVAIFLTQYMPHDFSISGKWQRLVYESLKK